MEELKKIYGLFFKAIPLFYFLGFCVINGYLTNLYFTEYNIINLTFLKAGILFGIFILIIILLVYFSFIPETMTDNYKKSWPSSVIALFTLHLLALLLVPIFDRPESLFNVNRKWGIALDSLKLLLVWVCLWAIYKKPKNIKGILLLTLFPVFIMIVILGIYSYSNSAIGTLWIFIIALGLKSFLSLGDIGDKKYKIGIIQDLFFVIAFALFFGKYLYPKIPSSFGGGKPYKVALSKNRHILNDTNNIRLDTFFVLYESDTRVLLKDDKNQILSIEKGELKEILIIKNSP